MDQAMKTILMLVAVGSVGCLQSNINGATNGSPTSSGTPAATGTAGSGSGSTAAASATGGSSAAASSTGGTTAGSVTGSSTGGSSNGAGTTGGTTSGDAGPCKPYGAQCGGNGECCTAACNQECLEPVGHTCLGDGDCSSGNCGPTGCACSTPAQSQYAVCATASDCCGGLGCQLTVISGIQYGLCCNPIGGSCQGDFDCCDQNCVNGQCQCLPVGSEECAAGECCLGSCEFGVQGLISLCQNGAGDPCTVPEACISSNCADGTCSTCSGSSGGPCATTADCCSGGVCAQALILNGVFLEGDGGSACCGPTGADCDAGWNGVSGCCSLTCGADGLCACAKVGDNCYNSDACCSGEACLPSLTGYACCQLDSQFCLSGYECCSGNCQEQSCACVPAGGACGVAGFIAPQGPAACCSGACGDAGTCL